ncbi:coniferyl aldehyde dehydrogenase [Acinetobacter larvae]|uniref:Aldehyde dehydrogenase n=1 Tax=Acinetobacter larvae TaxID=1789224 RepID=A0A1B2M2K5_9GAMM|nr:coniferyl aldehyde dehydrogenase [Acinetobacter larvae]AOA59428.1 coniferyl-aldehyde dehydrogenase [Acinetobacter larvae]
MNTHSNNNPIPATPPEVQRLQHLLQLQKEAYQRQPCASAKVRLERLAQLKQVLVQYQDDIAKAIHHDYGNRSIAETKIGELLSCLEHIKYYSKHLSQWMKPSKRHVGLIHQPAKAWVRYQPLGVIGIIAPWNYPLFLSIGPLICALAAGNHAMIKISSASTHFGHLLAKILAEAFPEELVAVVTDGGPISDAFSHLAFDKIIFTGSTTVGKTVMAAAAQNLVPVLLELGGKSPAIVHSSTDLSDVAERLAFGKLWNAGQTCVAPDYLFLPRGRVNDFVSAYQEMVEQMYPNLANNPDYTAIINNKQYQRIQGYLEDALAKGAKVIEINPEHEDLAAHRKIAPTLLLHVTADMQIMQEEIFAPVLPILEYDQIDEVIEFINQRPRPLALYYFDFDQTRADYVAQHTHSGHFGLNAVLTHAAQDDLPFGGVGASGMGKYHGPEGFFSFSHARSMMSIPKVFFLKFIFPPYHESLYKFLEKTFMR